MAHSSALTGTGPTGTSIGEIGDMEIGAHEILEPLAEVGALCEMGGWNFGTSDDKVTHGSYGVDHECGVAGLSKPGRNRVETGTGSNNNGVCRRWILSCSKA